jgi:phage tail-like protein
MKHNYFSTIILSVVIALHSQPAHAQSMEPAYGHVFEELAKKQQDEFEKRVNHKIDSIQLARMDSILRIKNMGMPPNPPPIKIFYGDLNGDGKSDIGLVDPSDPSGAKINGTTLTPGRLTLFPGLGGDGFGLPEPFTLPHDFIIDPLPAEDKPKVESVIGDLGHVILYAMQYPGSDFELVTTGTTSVTSIGQQGMTNASFGFPETTDFINAMAFLQSPGTPLNGGGGTSDGGDAYRRVYLNDNLVPQVQSLFQSNIASSEPLLTDPILSADERQLRTIIRGMDRSHRLTDVQVRGWDPDNKTQVTGKTQGDFNLANKFDVEIDGVLVNGVHKVEGLENETDIVEYKDGEDGTMHTRPGNAKPGKITITKDWSNTSEWYKWRQAILDGKIDNSRKSISIIFHNDAGEESMKYNFYNCYPSNYIGPSLESKNSGHATERIEFSYNSMDAEPSSWHFKGDLKTANGAMSQSTQQMTLLVPLTIGGVKANAMLIGLLMPPANATPVPTNTNDRTDININTNGWKWQTTIPNPNAQDNSSVGGAGGSSEGSKGGGRGYTAGHFALDLDGNSAGWLQSVEGGHATSDVTGDDNDPKRHHPGDITLNCGTGMSKGFYDWISGSFNHNYTRKDGAIIGANYDHKEISRLEFKNGLITEIGLPALDGSSKDPCKMSIKVSPEWTRQAKPDSTKKITGAYNETKQKMWLPSNFRLKIDGLEEACTKVNKVEAIVLKQKNVETAVGGQRSYEKEPANLEIPNLVITIPESHADGFYKWHDDFVLKGNKGGAEKNGTLDYLDVNGNPLFTLTFQNLRLFKSTPEKMEAGGEAIRRVKFEMYVENMKFNTGGSASGVGGKDESNPDILLTKEISWDPNKPLKPEDFNGTPPKNSDNDAESSVYFKFYWDKDKKAWIVVAVFDKDSSWMKDDATKKDSAVLHHEQRHFDIAELYARKLRKRIKELSEKDRTQENIDKIAKELADEMEKEQNKYDEDTNHGTDADKQKEWDQKIDKEMQEYKDYAK